MEYKQKAIPDRTNETSEKKKIFNKIIQNYIVSHFRAYANGFFGLEILLNLVMPRFNDLIKIYVLAKTSLVECECVVRWYSRSCTEPFIIHKISLPKLTKFRISLFDLDGNLFFLSIFFHSFLFCISFSCSQNFFLLYRFAVANHKPSHKMEHNND